MTRTGRQSPVRTGDANEQSEHHKTEARVFTDQYNNAITVQYLVLEIMWLNSVSRSAKKCFRLKHGARVLANS